MDSDDCETYRFVTKMLLQRIYYHHINKMPCSRWWPPRGFASPACAAARIELREIKARLRFVDGCKEDPCACSYSGLSKDLDDHS